MVRNLNSACYAKELARKDGTVQTASKHHSRLLHTSPEQTTRVALLINFQRFTVQISFGTSGATV